MLVQRYRAAAAEGLAALDSGVANPLARLQAYASWWAECIGNASVPLWICAMLGVEVRLHFALLAAWLEGVMAAGEADGCLQLSTTPAVQAQAFLATVHGAMLSARACGTPRCSRRSWARRWRS